MANDQYTKIGHYLRERREQLRLTREDVVNELKKQGIQISLPVLGRIESGETVRSSLGDAELMNALCFVLRLSIIDLFEMSGHMKPQHINPTKRHLLEIINILSATELGALTVLADYFAREVPTKR